VTGLSAAFPLLVTLALIGILALAAHYSLGRDADDSDDGGGGPGRGGPQQGRPPDGSPADDEFPWWAEFERDFADYVRKTGEDPSRSRRPPDPSSRARLECDPSRAPVVAYSTRSPSVPAPISA
jgi:hypothetical protein